MVFIIKFFWNEGINWVNILDNNFILDINVLFEWDKIVKGIVNFFKWFLMI